MEINCQLKVLPALQLENKFSGPVEECTRAFAGCGQEILVLCLVTFRPQAFKKVLHI